MSNVVINAHQKTTRSTCTVDRVTEVGRVWCLVFVELRELATHLDLGYIKETGMADGLRFAYGPFWGAINFRSQYIQHGK